MALEARHQHVADGRRRRRPAGALVREQGPDDDPRLPDRRVADEPGVGQLVGVGDALTGGVGGVRELGGAGLAGDRDAGDRGRGAGPELDDRHHHPLDESRRRGRW